MINIKALLFALTLFNAIAFSQNTKVKLNSVDITLPGKWEFVGKNEISGQNTFKSTDTKIAVSISARSKTKFSFFNDSLNDFELVNKFYHWDSDYWKEGPKYEVTEIKNDESKKLIIWVVKTPQGSNYILNGIKDSHLIGIQTQGNKANEEEKIKLLELIYSN